MKVSRTYNSDLTHVDNYSPIFAKYTLQNTVTIRRCVRGLIILDPSIKRAVCYVKEYGTCTDTVCKTQTRKTERKALFCLPSTGTSRLFVFPSYLALTKTKIMAIEGYRTFELSVARFLDIRNRIPLFL